MFTLTLTADQVTRFNAAIALKAEAQDVMAANQGRYKGTGAAAALAVQAAQKAAHDAAEAISLLEVTDFNKYKRALLQGATVKDGVVTLP